MIIPLLSLLLLATAAQEKDRTQELLKAISGTTKIVVRSGGLCHRRAEKEKVLAEVKDAEAIKKLIEGLKPGAGMGHCMCCGDPTLEFRSDDKLLASVAFHHSQSLRWEGWADDSRLSLDRAEFLVTWLTDRGVSGLKEDFERFRKEMQALDKILARTFAGLPAKLRDDTMKGPDAFAATLKAELPAAPDRIRALLKMMGAGNGAWKPSDGFDDLGAELLSKEDITTVQTVTKEGLLGNDRRLRRGAAKLWMLAEGPLAAWKPENPGALQLRVLDVRRDAFHPAVRADGIDDLERWAATIPAAELDARIGAALQDPDPSVRRRAMLAAGRQGLKTRAATLMDFLQDRPFKPAPGAEIPSDEKVMDEERDDPGHPKPAPTEPGEDWEWAALGLGWLRHEEARPLIVKKGPMQRSGHGSTMAAVALMLLGETDRIDEGYFSPHGPLEMRLAAIESVIRCRGRKCLVNAIAQADGHDWHRPAPRVEALKKMLLDEKAPGADLLKDATKSKDLMKWYDAHAAEFMKGLK